MSGLYCRAAPQDVRFTIAVVDEDEHLTAYRLLADDEPVRQVWLENQFDERDITVLGAIRLVAESRKLAWQEID